MNVADDLGKRREVVGHFLVGLEGQERDEIGGAEARGLISAEIASRFHIFRDSRRLRNGQAVRLKTLEVKADRLRISFSASATVSPAAMQPGKSDPYTEKLSPAFSITTA